MAELPIACELTPAALSARRAGLLADLRQRAHTCEPLADGYSLRFSPADDDTLMLIARAVDAERHCCRFLRFNITVEPGGGPISLELTGPPGTSEFIASLFDAPANR